MEITDYHARLFAHELKRPCASDEVDKFAPVLADAQVNLNPHPDLTEQDLLYEILLKDGFELTTLIETLDLHGFRVHSIVGGQMLVCLQDKLSHDLIQALAAMKPSSIVYLDRGFAGNDQLKANAAKRFATAGVDMCKTV